MATPAIQTLLTDAQQVLNLNSLSEVRATMAAALANANVGTPLNPNLTTQQLWDEFYLIVRQPESDIESIITNQLMKFLFAPPAPGGVGANGQVIFNDGGVLAGDAQFQWDKVTNQLTVGGTIQVTGNVAGQGALIGRDGGSGGATYGANTGNVSLSAPAGGTVRFNVNGGVFAGLFDASGNMGILNVSPFSGSSGGLTIGTLGSGAAKQLALQMANCYARFRERNVVNDISIITNINVDNVLDDNTRPSWAVRFGAGSDVFGVYRAAVASTTLTTLATVNPSGDFNLIGNVVPTSGKGIDFSANNPDPAGRTSELLNDYEEGTWSGTIKGSVSDPTIAVSTNGRYTKIGRSVTVDIVFAGVSTVGAVGDISVTGLPFANGSVACIGSAGIGAILAYSGTLTSVIDPSGTTVFLVSQISSSYASLATHVAGASKNLLISITYSV